MSRVPVSAMLLLALGGCSGDESGPASIAELEAQLARNPTDCFVSSQLGAAHQRAGEFETAIEYQELSLSHCPDDAMVRFQLGVSQLMTGNLEGGRQTMESAVAVARSNGDNELAALLDQEMNAWLGRWAESQQ